MLIHELLASQHINCFPISDGSGSQKEKEPLVRGFLDSNGPWQWPNNGLAGVPIPENVFVIDLDTYKGVTRESVENALGVNIPWDSALIQNTRRGGQHYAFYVGGRSMRQTSAMLGVRGFDTRAHGSGYIATGIGYTSIGAGIIRLAHPEHLPRLPEAAIEKMQKVQHVSNTTAATQNINTDTLKEALRYIDPDCLYADWLQIIMALRSAFEDDENIGMHLATEWSRGDYWASPATKFNGVEEVQKKWSSVKPSGGITAATIYYRAIESGWTPPASIDASSIFSDTDLAEFNALICRIKELAANPLETSSLIDMIHKHRCGVVQKELLKSVLMRELKEAGLLTPTLKKAISPPSIIKPANVPDVINSVEIPPSNDILDFDSIVEKPITAPSADHSVNACFMHKEIFNYRLAYFRDYGLRWWRGTHWQSVHEDKLERLATFALIDEQGKAPTVKGTVHQLRPTAPVRYVKALDRCIFFKNGVLDTLVNKFHAHHCDNNNLHTLDVDYAPQAQCPEWHAHLSRLFEGLADGSDRVLLLQEIIGWLLITDRLGIEKVIAFDGVSRAGKGVILKTVQSILGSKCSSANFSAIGSDKTRNSFLKYDVMIDLEAKPPKRTDSHLAIETINKVASNEALSREILYDNESRSSAMNCKYVFACNGIPVLIDDSGASSTRFLTLMFDRSFVGKEDTGIAARLSQELEGIAAWALVGLYRLIENQGRFTMPESSIVASSNLNEANQPLRDFINDYCVIGKDERVLWPTLWEHYKVFCTDHNMKLPRKHTFYRSLRMTVLSEELVEERKSMRVDDQRGKGFHGLGVRT